MDTRSLQGRIDLAQKIKTITIEKRIVTVSYIDQEELLNVANWLITGLAFLAAFLLYIHAYYGGESDSWKFYGISIVSTTAFVTFATCTIFARKKFLKRKSQIMKQNGWDGKRPAEMRVCTASSITLE